ncbi:MAG TPA: spore coat protein YlbD, partial [Bacillus sp. (in: firmicutes)]
KTDGNSKKANTDWMKTVLGSLKNMDPNQMQHYLGHLSQAIGSIQGVLSQFQNGSAQNHNSSQQKSNNPFLFRKD